MIEVLAALFWVVMYVSAAVGAWLVFVAAVHLLVHICRYLLLRYPY